MQGTSCAVLVNVYDQTKCKIIVIALDSVYILIIMKGRSFQGKCNSGGCLNQDENRVFKNNLDNQDLNHNHGDNDFN